ICVGVGLMAVDMFTSRRGATASIPPRAPAGDSLGLNPAPASVPPVGSLSVPEAAPPLKPEP
ncbi:MAG TPA: hypothetical protein VEQ58_21395, partial [Polyangiaceae bacterium]|nr:hypothetical protein [Polyangiaceae bacterium]